MYVVYTRMYACDTIQMYRDVFNASISLGICNVQCARIQYTYVDLCRIYAFRKKQLVLYVFAISC